MALAQIVAAKVLYQVNELLGSTITASSIRAFRITGCWKWMEKEQNGGFRTTEHAPAFAAKARQYFAKCAIPMENRNSNATVGNAVSCAQLTNSSSGPQTPRGFLRMASPLLRKRLAPFGPTEHGR